MESPRGSQSVAQGPCPFLPFVQKEARWLLETPQLSLWRFSPGSFPAGAPSQPHPTLWLGPYSSRGDPSFGNVGIQAGADPRDWSKEVAVFESFRPASAAPPAGLGGASLSFASALWVRGSVACNAWRGGGCWLRLGGIHTATERTAASPGSGTSGSRTKTCPCRSDLLVGCRGHLQDGPLPGAGGDPEPPSWALAAQRTLGDLPGPQRKRARVPPHQFLQLTEDATRP